MGNTSSHDDDDGEAMMLASEHHHHSEGYPIDGVSQHHQYHHHHSQQVHYTTPIATSSLQQMQYHHQTSSGQAQQQHLNHQSPSALWSEFPLHHAACTGASIAELNRLVVHEGFDVDQPDATGSTPLHLAAYYGHENAVKWLANKGRARYIKDIDGNTPADCARQSGFLELADFIQRSMTVSNVGLHQNSPPPSPYHRNGDNDIIGIKTGPRNDRHRLKEESLYLELDRAQAKIASLKASEKRVRQELEQEVAERLKLFRIIVSAQELSSKGDMDQQQHQFQHPVNLSDTLTDMRLQILEYKAQRDAMAAELKLVEDALADFELFVTGERGNTPGALVGESSEEGYIAPSARLRACLRRI